MSQHFEMVVIGSGPAGRRAAVQGAKLNRNVLVVEKGRKVGGVSVHTGTIPSKTLRETVLNLTGYRERGFYGQAYRVKTDISAGDLMRRLQITLNHEVDILENQFHRNRVQIMRGHARFLDAHTIEVRDDSGFPTKVSSDSFVIAVGTHPRRPASIPFDGKDILDSDDILEIERLPRKLVVIGAGVIGIEYATIFSALDVDVTVIEGRDTMLDFIDSELLAEFMHELRDRGIDVRLRSPVASVDHVGPADCVIHLEDGRQLRSDMVLFAAGRTSATDTLDIDKAGLAVDDRGRLSVDKTTFRSAVPHIYAAGDVIGFPSLASTSMEQGRIAACCALGAIAHEPPKFFPYGIYAVPEISTVGMTEEEMRARGIPYECGIARFRETARGQIMGIKTGMLKAIFSLKTRRLLGVHIVGEGATELVHIGQAVLNLKGTIDFFIENVFNYPTLAEAYKIAALDAFNRMPSWETAA